MIETAFQLGDVVTLDPHRRMLRGVVHRGPSYKLMQVKITCHALAAYLEEQRPKVVAIERRGVAEARR